MRTEHNRNTYLQQMTHLRHPVEQVVVFRVIRLIDTLCLETVSRTGVQIPEIQTGLKEEMTVLEVIGKVQSCTRTTDQLLQSVALFNRTGTHVGIFEILHHGCVTYAET